MATAASPLSDGGESRYLDHPIASMEGSSASIARKPSLDSLGIARNVVHITVIDANTLSRSCLTRCLVAAASDFSAAGYRSVDEWVETVDRKATAIVLLCAVGQTATEAAVKQDVQLARLAAPEGRIIVVSDLEHPTQIIEAVDRGASGYIATSSQLDLLIATIRLVKAGGTFIPAASLVSQPTAAAEASTDEAHASKIFTARQLEVIQSLRKGESNKIIAYKLGMGECTVKVHVRNIMRKIQARNRTEVAFLTNDLFEEA
jgi:DNA-binding NarL/FixJ family response regulator